MATCGGPGPPEALVVTGPPERKSLGLRRTVWSSHPLSHLALDRGREKTQSCPLKSQSQFAVPGTWGDRCTSELSLCLQILVVFDIYRVSGGRSEPLLLQYELCISFHEIKEEN